MKNINHKIIRHAAWTLFLAGMVHGLGQQVNLDVSMARPYLPAGKPDKAYLKVGLTGFHIDPVKERAPVNVAIVLDKSGSMQGDKILHAKQAAKEAIRLLGPRDIVSVVTYDTQVNVLTPATKVSDKSDIESMIDRIQAGGSTALFAGVSKGAAEARKFIDPEIVNRVILLSDGKANVGLSSPGELGALGASLIKEGVSVSTIGLGLGYNEDLMMQLAMRSDGNHVFVESPDLLSKIFQEEFGDILSVVAQEVEVRIQCQPGIRPVRVLGRQAEVSGSDAYVYLNQVYSNQQKYIILELDAPPGNDGQVLPVANVSLSYRNLKTGEKDRLSGRASVRYTASEEEVARNVNREVMISCVTQIAAETNLQATALRDEGKIEAARQLLYSNSAFLRKNAADLDSDSLRTYGGINRMDAENLDGSNWNEQRKRMRYIQSAVINQAKGSPEDSAPRIPQQPEPKR